MKGATRAFLNILYNILIVLYILDFIELYEIKNSFPTWVPIILVIGFIAVNWEK